MNQFMWYIAKPQGVDTTLVYCDATGEIILYESVTQADKVAEEIGPDWQAQLLPIGR